ncbi:DUF2513 domain-containing protein [Kiloniella litopenaei]|uniref:DUF2513 domain-containing protein n=1 Tax=Kiloniella litopenaei TaxID=1549748 RepID=UPI0009E50C91
MEELKYIKGEGYIGGGYCVERITSKGHDFIDSVRDPKIWAKTKKGVLEAGGFSIELLSDLAKGLIKQQISKATGVDL